MTTRNTVHTDRDIVRRDHLARLEAGPEAIAHLVRTDDAGTAKRRRLTEEVSEIGRQNRLAAAGKAKDGQGTGKARNKTAGKAKTR